MFLLLGALVFVYGYFVVRIRGKHRWQSRGRQMASSESSEYNTDVSSMPEGIILLSFEAKLPTTNKIIIGFVT